MSNNWSNIGVVILAAGEGKRMKSELPKVMHAVHGKPMVGYVVEAVEQLGIKPIVVVNNKHSLVQDYLRDRAQYVIQDEQLGTGHAVLQAKSLLQGAVEHVVVLYGDMPFITAESIKKLVSTHTKGSSLLTMITTMVPHFEDGYESFNDFSRVIRNEQGDIQGIVEKKDATEEQLCITELNTCYMCFSSDWLWDHLQKLQNNNAQGEYYLVDLVRMAVDEGIGVTSLACDPEEAVGINSQEHLKSYNASV